MKTVRRVLLLILLICISAGTISADPFSTAAYAEMPNGDADTVIGSDRTVYQNRTPENPEEVFRYTVETVSDGDRTFQAVIITGINKGFSGLYPNLDIPEEIDGKPVLKIANMAFQNNTDLVSVSLPESLKTMGEGAFSGCPNLRQIDLSAAMQVTELPPSFVSYCTSLAGVIFHPNHHPDVGDFAFQGCRQLDEIRLSSSVGISAFSGCTGLKSAVLGEGAALIGSRAFHNCSTLESLIISDSVTEAGTEMILACKNLKILSIGCGLNDLVSSDASVPGTQNPFYIGDGSALETLILAEGITGIGESRLANCVRANYRVCGFANLKTVLLPTTLTSIEDGNLSAWANAAHVTRLSFGPALSSITESAGSRVLRNLILYSDEENPVLTAFAQEKSIRYIIGSDLPDLAERAIPLLPGQHVRLPAPAGPMPEEGTPCRFFTGSGALSLGEDGVVSSETEGSYTVFVETEDGAVGKYRVDVTEMDTLMLPADLYEIQTEAFANCGAERIVLSSETAVIGSRAFAENTSLNQVVIPNSAALAEKDSFENSDPVLICEEDSDMIAFARSHGLTHAFLIED